MNTVQLSDYYFNNFGTYQGKQATFKLQREPAYDVIKETEKAVLVLLTFKREGEAKNEKSVMEFTRETWIAKKLLKN